jgi:hypothetical protein
VALLAGAVTVKGVLPSPKLKVYVLIGFDPGVDPDASAVTRSGAAPELGLTLSAAIGGVLTTTTLLAVAPAPVLSVAVSVTVKVPLLAYVWVAVEPA